MRSRPSWVLAPVDMPPWFLQRPFFIALATHGRPLALLVRAASIREQREDGRPHLPLSLFIVSHK